MGPPQAWSAAEHPARQLQPTAGPQLLHHQQPSGQQEAGQHPAPAAEPAGAKSRLKESSGRAAENGSAVQPCATVRAMSSADSSGSAIADAERESSAGTAPSSSAGITQEVEMPKVP